MPRSEFGLSLCYLSEVSLVVAISQGYFYELQKKITMWNAYFLLTDLLYHQNAHFIL